MTDATYDPEGWPELDPEPVECEHCCGSGNTKVHVKGASVDAPCTPCGGQGIRERDA
jgi:DnaJ-class molecular chaperone